MLNPPKTKEEAAQYWTFRRKAPSLFGAGNRKSSCITRFVPEVRPPSHKTLGGRVPRKSFPTLIDSDLGKAKAIFASPPIVPLGKR